MTLSRKIQPERISEAAYFAYEEQSETRHDYIDGYIYAMAGSSINHDQLSGNIYSALRVSLKGQPCRPFSGNMKVRLPRPAQRADYVYPDVAVDCSAYLGSDKVLTTPVLIVEVLSDSTHKYDETAKFLAYIELASLQEYILIEQNCVRVEVFRRRTGWVSEKFFLGDDVTFESVDLTLSVEEIYDRVDNNEMKYWLKQKDPATALSADDETFDF